MNKFRNKKKTNKTSQINNNKRLWKGVKMKIRMNIFQLKQKSKNSW